MDLIKIGQLIAERRKERKMTQNQLGELLGISGKSVSKWERGINMPDLDKLKQLCIILDIELEDILNCDVNSSISTGSVNNKIKNSKMKFVFIVLLFLLLILFVFTFSYTFSNYNKDIIYTLSSSGSDYAVEGFLVETPDYNYFIINTLHYQSELVGTTDEPLIKQIYISILYEDSVVFNSVEDFEPLLLSLKLNEISFSVCDDKISKTNVVDYNSDLSEFRLKINYVTIDDEQIENIVDLDFTKIFSNNKIFY